MFVDIKCRTLKIQFTDYLYPKENSVFQLGFLFSFG